MTAEFTTEIDHFKQAALNAEAAASLAMHRDPATHQLAMAVLALARGLQNIQSDTTDIRAIMRTET